MVGSTISHHKILEKIGQGCMGEEAPLTQIQVILNWFEELKRLVPTDN